MNRRIFYLTRGVNMTTFFEHQKSSFKKSYLRNLISIASSDGLLDDDEKILVYKIGKARGLKEWQINELLEEDNSQHEIFIPESVSNRMNLLFDIMQMIYADGTVTSNEVEYIQGLVTRFNLRSEIVHHLIDLFQYGTPSTKDWNEFVQYINEVFTC
jgi:uncharacterized tellurite resistance protein B-like protein